MAPISPAKRVTRARAAAKKTDTIIDAPKRKLAASKVANSTADQKAKSTTMSEEPPIEKTEQPKKASTRTTKAASLASAPRRRIKVTPLDAPLAVEEPGPEPPQESTTTKRITTKTKQTKPANEKAAMEKPESQPKTRTRTPKVTEKKSAEQEQPVPKTRGRPKRATAVQKEKNSEEPRTEAAPTTRQTRGRTASNTEPTEGTAIAAPKTKTGKKVTFQDLPEDDKENHPVPTRKTAARKDTTPATGMRAKPVRKPAAAATKKSTTTSKSKVAKTAARPLTPKKVSQVNRQSTPESSDTEDELSGSKTPVRDLSLSPKRNPQLGARLSPVKKLEFGQQRQSPDRMADRAMLFSPARRPASPSRETFVHSPLKEAPRRVEIPPVFPTSEQTMNMTASFAPSSMSQSVLLQSPRRVQLDSSAFSQSAMKPKTSPLKHSFLQSPARRLFSPAKRKTPEISDRNLTVATPEEVAVSSHFRASVSPQRSARVHRMSEDELAAEMKDAIDFDQSVLSVRSPLKVGKPIESRTEPEDEDVPMVQNELASAASEDDDHHSVAEMTDVQGSVADAAVMEQRMNSSLSEESSEDSHFQETSNSGQDAKEDSTIMIPTEGPTMRGTRLSEVLFRSGRSREEDESSEDELAAEMTPARTLGLFRSSLTGAGKSSRLSTVAPSSLSRNVGFTPLAAQMSGWLAASPEKKSAKKQQPRGIFSPVAAQHIDGEVQISRQSTPRQHRSPLAASQMSSAQSVRSRTSLAPSMGPSPEKTSFFEEQMMAHDAEDQVEDAGPMEAAMASNVTQEAREDSILFDEDQRIVAATESHDDTVVLEEANGELTTDLINFTNASDTAMVDFNKLAEEADQLAPSEGDMQQLSSDNSVYGDENAAPEDDQPASATEVSIVKEQIEAHTSDDEIDSYAYHAMVDNSPIAQDDQQELEVEKHIASISGSPSVAESAAVEMVTPVRPDLSLPRYVNTVVSKVPLRPEGDVSPIGVPKKRSRSLSAAGHNGSPPKRAQLTPIGKLAPRSKSENMVSPDRRIRSAAPSPAHTTPGQMSFAVDDFGDSTLDGIELPEDEMDFDVGPPTATATPASVKSVKSRKTAVPTPTRTPLKSVGIGILHGAVVYVEVHTTEGADASGVYVDLLTQMGARCVKDWRWNSRASINGAEDSASASKIGITHVVYKDGGKRTLEKVRDAKGEIWCVGVRWVLE